MRKCLAAEGFILHDSLVFLKPVWSNLSRTWALCWAWSRFPDFGQEARSGQLVAMQNSELTGNSCRLKQHSEYSSAEHQWGVLPCRRNIISRFTKKRQLSLRISKARRHALFWCEPLLMCLYAYHRNSLGLVNPVLVRLWAPRALNEATACELPSLWKMRCALRSDSCSSGATQIVWMLWN